MGELSLSVSGMTCPTCEESIQRALSRLDGVRSVRADHRTGTVLVGFDASPDEGTVRTAIEDAGYDLARAGKT